MAIPGVRPAHDYRMRFGFEERTVGNARGRGRGGGTDRTAGWSLNDLSGGEGLLGGGGADRLGAVLPRALRSPGGRRRGCRRVRRGLLPGRDRTGGMGGGRRSARGDRRRPV